MQGIRYTNFNFDKSKYYLFYISELKGYGIGSFFGDAVASIKHLERDKVVVVGIAPDVLGQYNYDNIIIVNQTTHRENQRKGADGFMREISHNAYIHEVIARILSNQNELLLYMFESNALMTLDQKAGIELIGPQSDIVSMLSNKIALYDIFSASIPMASYHVCHGLEALTNRAEVMLRDGQDTLFVSLEKSAAGANSMIVQSVEQIEERFSACKEDTFLLTAFISHVSDPTSLGVVINEDEVYVAGIADQKINGTKFEGSIYPSQLSATIQEKLIDYTRVVGQKMASLGFRGIFGCDFIVTDKDEIYFIETNPRKQGTTMEFCCMLQKSLPEDAPNLPELEYYAVKYSKSAPDTKEPDYGNPKVYWETYNYKVRKDVSVYAYLPQYNNEREMFDNVVDHKIEKEYMVVEHAGEDFSVKKGSFLGRVISVGKNYRDIHMGIDMGKKILNCTCDTLSQH